MSASTNPESMTEDNSQDLSPGEQLDRVLQQAAEAMAAAHTSETSPAADPMSHETPVADEALQRQVAEMKDQVLRTMAEMENVRSRARRDVEEASRYAVAGFARDIISVLENLYRAAASVPQESRAESPLLNTLAQGIDMTLAEFVNVMQRHGIQRVDPLGQPFDHNFHMAVAQMESTEHAPGTVMQVMQAGYVLHDRLLRPAMVGVAKAPQPGEGSPQVDTQA
jgi:molecular chaperone GrpE